jgi:hypothetical protein
VEDERQTSVGVSGDTVKVNREFSVNRRRLMVREERCGEVGRGRVVGVRRRDNDKRCWKLKTNMEVAQSLVRVLKCEEARINR